MTDRIMPAHKYRVLLIFPSLEDRGGVVIFCKNILGHISKKFSYEHFVTGNIVGNKSFIRRIIEFLRNYFLLKKKIKKNIYDIIHLNPSFAIFALIRDTVYLKTAISRGMAGKVVVFFHGWNPLLVKKISHSFILKRIFKKTYQKVGVIFVLSRLFKQQLIELGINADRISVTTTFFEEMGHKKKVLVKSSKKVNILYMSRLVKNKGALIAAKVGKLLAQDEMLDFILTIAGDGPEFQTLQKYINNHNLTNYIMTPGFVSGCKKNELLLESDIFLFPTFYNEGCPIVVLEAMGAGAAIVSTPVGAIPDIIIDGVNGYILNNRSARQFCNAVRRLIDDRNLLKKMQSNNRKKAEEKYTFASVIKNIEVEYEKILNDSYAARK